MLGHVRQHHHPLRQRQRRADAKARPVAEGNVGTARLLAAARRREALGIEPFRSLPQCPVTMNDPGDDADKRTGRNRASADLVGRERLAPWEGVNRREQPQRLVEDHARVGQTVNIVEAGCPAAQRLVGLRPEPLLRVGVLREQKPCPAERQRRGLVAGDEDGDHLIPHLLRRQPAPGLGVAPSEKPIQQVLVRGRAAAARACLHDLRHQGVEIPQEPFRAPCLVARPRPVDARNQRKRAEGHFRLVADGTAVKRVLDERAVRREQGVGDDVERQSRHGVFHVQRVVGVVCGPPAQHVVGRRRDGAGVACDAPGAECRRHDAAVPAPGLAFAGDETVAQRRRQQRANDLRLDVVRGIVLQDVLHAVRMVHQEVVEPEEFPLGDVFPEVGGVEAADQAVAHRQGVSEERTPPFPRVRKDQCRPLLRDHAGRVDQCRSDRLSVSIFRLMHGDIKGKHGDSRHCPPPSP